MTKEEALKLAEKQMFPNGAPYWRWYTLRERQKLTLLTRTIWCKATGKVWCNVKMELVELKEKK